MGGCGGGCEGEGVRRRRPHLMLYKRSIKISCLLVIVGLSGEGGGEGRGEGGSEGGRDGKREGGKKVREGEREGEMERGKEGRK